MISNRQRWRILFLSCLGLALGAGFCMKWMEGDFLYNGKLFTIIGLEVSYPKEKIIAILGGLSAPVRSILRYHLVFDFAFMAGVYPAITALCMLARGKLHTKKTRRFLIILAILPFVAWICDIIENRYLLHWLDNPGVIDDLSAYHTIVWLKWCLAGAAVLIATPLALKRKKTSEISFQN